MRIAVLGPLQVTGLHGPVEITAPKQRRLLGLLLANRGTAVSIDRIAWVLWGDGMPADPAGSVAFHVSKLRKLLDTDTESSVIETTPSGYRLADGVDTDADEFELGFDEARRLVGTDPARARALLNVALGMWRGKPLDDVGADEYAPAEVRRLAELRIRAVQLLSETDLDAGDADRAVARLEQLVADEPLRERPVALLMRSLLALGRRSEALTVFEGCRSRLGTDLGIEPGAELQRVYEEALEQLEPRPDLVNPYRGLRPFGEDDADFFFGREALTAHLVDRVSMGERLLAVVGPSGSGKSSVVRAGLIPRIRAGAVEGSEGWPVCVMTPGLHPFEQLESALLRGTGSHLAGVLDVLVHDERGLARAVQRLVPEGAGRVMVVIDQFEELYRVSDDAERAAFEAAVASAASDPSVPVVMVLALRADHYDRPLAHAGLAGLLGSGTVTVPPMGTSELERAISGPAGRVGVSVSPELEARIITDVMDRPGELPLVQFALTETFDRRTGGGLGVEEYEQVGGVDGALVSVAEALYAELDDTARDSLRRVMLHLVTVDGEGETRRRVPLADLAPDGMTDEVLHRLDERRLITLDRDPASGEATVEVAHEALFRAWPRYAGWIDTHRDDLSLRQRLSAATHEWTQSGEDLGYLLSGSRLDLFEGWAGTTDLTLTPTDSRFLDASLEARRVAAEHEESRRARERELEQRTRTRTRLVAGIGSVAILIALLAVFAWTQRNQAQDALADARTAEAEAVAAQVEAVAASEETQRVVEAGQLVTAAINNLEVDADLSILLAYEAIATTARVNGTVLPEAVDAMHWALQEAQVTYPYADPPVEVRLGPNGLRGVFAIPIEDLLQLAADSVTRGLSTEECQTYLRKSSCAVPTGRVFDKPLVELERTVESRASLDGTQLVVADPAVENWPLYHAMGEALGITVHISKPFGAGITPSERFPDLFIAPQPGLLPDDVTNGQVIRLEEFVDRSDAIRRYGPDLVALGSVGTDGEWPSDSGSLYALFTKLDVKSLVWYPKEAFDAAGYEVPSTWAELENLVSRIKSDGGTPWCAGNASGGYDNGWPGTDVIENLVLHAQGPEVYRAWAAGEIGFADPRIASAFTTYVTMVHGEGAYRGPTGRLSDVWWGNLRPMFEDPPLCWLWPGASFTLTPFILEDAGVSAEELDWFPFLSDDPQISSALVVGGQAVVVHYDRPEVRAFVEAIRTDLWHSMVAAEGAVLVPDGDYDVNEYPNSYQREFAGLLQDAKTGGGVVFDASDLMPDAIGSVTVGQDGLPVAGLFWQLMVDLGDDRSYYENPERLMARLQEIDDAWAELRAAGGS